MLSILSLIALCEMLNVRYKQNYCHPKATASIIPKPDDLNKEGSFCICLPFVSTNPLAQRGTLVFDHDDLNKSLNDLFTEIKGVLDPLVENSETT